MSTDVIQFPSNNKEENNTPLGTDANENELHPGNADSLEENIPEDAEEVPQELISDPDDPLNSVNEYQIKNMISQLGDVVRVMQNMWEYTKNEFKIEQEHINQLKAFNTNHAEPMPENLTDEEKENWNPFNGLDKLTEDDVDSIFNDDHPLSTHSIPLSLSIDRCKEFMNDLNNYINALAEYSDVHNAYIELIENEEAKNIEILKTTIENETDPEKKEKMQKSLDEYYMHKTLGFLADPLSDAEINKFITAWKDEEKITYLINRTRDKLKILKLSDRSILEISQFEKRFLPEKYHEINNMLLLYFLNITAYCNPDNKKDENRLKVYDMIIILDKFVRNKCTEEYKNQILENIIKFEDQFLGKVESDDKKNE